MLCVYTKTSTYLRMYYIISYILLNYNDLFIVSGTEFDKNGATHNIVIQR